MSNHIEQPEAKSQAQAKNDTHSALLDDSIGKPFSLKAAGETQPADTTQSSIEHKINLASLSSITTKDNTANVAPLLQYDSKMTFSEKALRVGQVSAEGLVYSVPGALHAVEHDLSPANWKETGIKILSAGAMGAAMRVALPESGAVKAIVGTAMAVYFMKDAAKPVISAWGDVTSKRGDDVMTRAAQNMGDGIGAFAVDSYLSAKVAGFTGKMTPILAEKYVPGQWSALEGWKTAHMGPSSTIGLELTSALDYADSKFKSLSDRLNPPKLGISELSREQILSSLADSKEAGARADYSEKVYSHGLTGSDGNAHGLDGTVDLLLQGKDPRTVPGGTAESEIPGKSTNKTGFTQLDGWSKNKDGLYVPDYINQAEAAHQSLNIDIDTADARARGTSSPRGRGSSKGTLRGDAAATTDTTPKTPGPTNPAEKVLNAETMGKVAGVIKAQLASVDDTTSIIRDRVNRETTAVHVATDPDYKTMDPAYLQARNAMVDLANQVGDDPKNFMQVDPLFKRLGDATTQAHAADLGPEGQHVARMNTYTKENQTTYVHNMIKEGIDPEKALAQKPLAPLVELSDDQSPVGVDPKTGKVVTAHEGPHTVRAIYGPNGEPIWPIDLIKNPIREMGVRGYLTSGIYGHEEFHDQFGQLGKLDPEVRDAHLMGAAQKALGADADVKIDIPHATPTELAAQQVELKGALEVLAEALKRAKGEKGAGIASAGEGKGLTIDRTTLLPGWMLSEANVDLRAEAHLLVAATQLPRPVATQDHLLKR